jgi:hypothetical protein
LVRKARREFKAKCERAAIKLQKMWRGRADRKRFKIIKAAKLARMRKENEVINILYIIFLYYMYIAPLLFK